MSLRLLLPPVLVGACVLVAVGCSSEDTGDQPSTIDPKTKIEVFENGFESDDPAGRTYAASSGSAADGGVAASSSGGTSGNSGAPSAGGDEAARTVQEADIVKLDGTRLYALSQYGGLAIVDVSDPAHMKLLGRKRTEGMPFEMYVEKGRAYITLNEFGRYVENGGYGQWVQTSELLAFDVSNPAQITELGHFDVPGTISDSRLVGDALYLVTFENGYCYNCGTTPATIVTSFGVKSGVTKVDQLAFRAPHNGYSWWQRSVSATNQRLYIGGPSWSWDGVSEQNRQSVVQIVDISDPAGKLTKGADVPVAGQINSRWQMDEYDGYLRVVSQFGNGWWGNGNNNPVVQTFKINSSSSLTAAGSTQLIMPMPETLRSVRFDGVRGYAITAQQTDPLFTIDLSNPTAPKQVGTLEMPGFIFHMEPRGDRLVGFGQDNGSLAVSLFDVSDMAKPTMLSRVNVGGGWGQIGGEDADRIHKALRVLDDSGVILLPFTTYGNWTNAGCEKPKSGIQIIDYSKAGLTMRGLAPQHGLPRRAMLLPNNHLLGMSDRQVNTFDIASRDNPTKKGELDLSNPAYRMVETPTHIASMTNDWWSGEPSLSLTPRDNADDANATGKVSLAELVGQQNQSSCGYYYGYGRYTAWYDARLFAKGTTVVLTVPVYEYGADASAKSRVVVATIDTSNPAAPRLVGKTSIPLSRQQNSYYGYGYGWCGVGLDGYAFYSSSMYGGLVGAGDSFVFVNDKLAYLEVISELVDDAGNPYDPQTPIYDYAEFQKKYHNRYSRILHTVDVANPANPISEAAITLPDSLGSTPLHVINGTLLTSRWVPSPTTPGKVRFYVDRVETNGPTRALSSLNVPGSLLHVDGPSSRIVTTDYRVTRFPATGQYQSCYESGNQRAQFVEGSCVVVDRDFKLADVAGTKVTLRQKFTPPSQYIGGVQVTDDRIYMTHYTVYDYRAWNGGYPGGVYQPPPVIEQGGLWAIGGLRAGNLSIVSQLSAEAQWPLAAKGTKVAVYQANGLAIYDTTNAVPAVVTNATLRGYGYSSHVLLSPDHAVASLGEWGLQTMRW